MSTRSDDRRQSFSASPDGQIGSCAPDRGYVAMNTRMLADTISALVGHCMAV
jgi:hypothetical protein